MTPGILPVVVLGALLGLALLQLRWVLFPPAPDLVAEVEAWRRGRERAELRAGTPTPESPLGRLTRWVNETLRARRPEFLDTLAPDLAVTGRCLARVGVTGVTDATHALGSDRLAVLRSAVEAGDLAQRLVLLGVDEGDEGDEAVGWAALGPLLAWAPAVGAPGYLQSLVLNVLMLVVLPLPLLASHARVEAGGHPQALTVLWGAGGLSALAQWQPVAGRRRSR